MMTDDLKQSDDIELVEDAEGIAPDVRDKINKWRERLKKCEAERREYLAGWQRAKADHINYKNDEGRRFEDMARFATSGLIQEILPVLDSFDLALGHGLPEDFKRGVVLIKSQLEEILKKRGLAEIEVKSGDEFDPEKHESLGEVAADVPEGKVAEVTQRGYLLHDKVLRAVRVRLAKGNNL